MTVELSNVAVAVHKILWVLIGDTYAREQVTAKVCQALVAFIWLTTSDKYAFNKSNNGNKKVIQDFETIDTL